MMASPGGRLRAMLARPGPLVLPLAYDALSAKLVENTGFEAVGISGSGVAAALLGLPDVGLLTMTETVDQARRITAVVGLPTIADADTGYGDALATARTVRELEGAGVAGLFLEDQQDPKRCGHLEGKRLVLCEEMSGKVRAALRARRDPNLVIIARTDALAVEGMEGAVARAWAYQEAGADLVFVAAPSSEDDLRALPRLIDAPLMVALTEGGVTPLLSVSELSDMGYKIIAYAGTAIASAAWAVREALRTLKRQGTTGGLLERMLGLEERNLLLGLGEYQALEAETIPTSE